MSNAKQKVKLKLQIKGSPNYKFEYKGRLDEALDLAISALNDVKRHVLHEME